MAINPFFLQLRPAKTEETTPAAQVGMLSSFLNIGKRYLLDYITFAKPKYLALEIASYEQKTHFYMYPPVELKGYFTSQILSQYPKTLIAEEKEDPLYKVVKGRLSALATLAPIHSFNYPIKTYKQFTELPPLSAVLGFLARLTPEEAAFFQIVLRVPRSQAHLQRSVRSSMKSTDVATGKETASPHSSLMQEKLSSPLLDCQMRLVFSSTKPDSAKTRITELAGSFGVYTSAEGNSLIHYHVNPLLKKQMFNQIAHREFFMFQPIIKLNLEEVASLWHLPDKKFEKTKGIYWGKQLLSEAPETLPVAETTADEDKHNTNFFGKTEWRNHDAIFGIKREDRAKHMYTIGKTGAGKSTLIANMAINDIRNGEGVAVIDPHGDLTEMILEFVPKRRMQDVIYLDPTLSDDRAFSLNLFDQEGAEHTDVIASGIVSVFYKLYHDSWGPRLEYILRNTILSLLYYEDATFADMLRILSNKTFRAKVVEKLEKKDPILAAFWTNEFEKMTDKLRIEAISPIQNKVGQFLSSLRIRNIVDNKTSTFSLEDVMNNKKILLLNLSQGKLGEDTTALLGAMFITKMQLTAMRRVNLPVEKRNDFYLYVDEFQNFATSSFVKILSEARKYRLNLILANQYIGQVEEDIQKAIFGNVGTLITFVIGAGDATHFEKEFGGKFTADDLVALGKYQVLMKMTINGLTSEPFVAGTLPLPSVRNNNKDKIIRLCLEKYYRKV